MAPTLTHEILLPHVGSTFTVSVDGTPGLPLELIAVTPRGQRHPASTRDPFVVLFRGPVAPILPQATYPFEHPVLPPLEVFIVPVGRTAAGVEYEAVFG